MIELEISAEQEAATEDALILDDESVRSEPSTGAFLNQVQKRRGVIEGQIRAEVEKGLGDARRTMATDPAGAAEDLKLLLEVVERTPDLQDEVKRLLRDRIVTAIRQSQRRQAEHPDKLKDRRKQPNKAGAGPA